MTNFAKGLAAGTIVVPAKTSWWPRHTRALLRHLTLSSGKTAAAKGGVIDILKLGAKEWEDIIPRAASCGVMDEHVALEIELVDAVKKNDIVRLESVGKRLVSNTTQLTAVMGIAIPEFPEKCFKHLLMDHVSLYATAVRKHIEDGTGNRKEIDANTLQLAAMTAEWL